MSQVPHLFQLQKMDTELEQISQRLNEISKIIQNDQTLQLAEKTLTQSRANLHRAHLELRTSEEHVSEQRIKIETSESNLYGGKIRNPKELQDLQNEITSLKKYLVVLEDEQLNAMLAYEQAEVDLKNAEKNMETAYAQVSTQQSGLLGEKNRLEHLQEKLLLERQVSQSQISTENLAIYNHLREQKRGLAVSVIEDDSCQACGSSLRPAELQIAKSPNKITFCSSCGRIIYAG